MLDRPIRSGQAWAGMIRPSKSGGVPSSPRSLKASDVGTECRPIPRTDEQIEQAVAFLGATYGAVSPDGEDHFAVVVRKDFELSASGPAFRADDVAAIRARTLVMAADDDLLPIERFADLYRAIPDAELSIVPGTSHFLLQEKPEACNAIILDFLSSDPVATIAPTRRAPATPAR